ncbi:MAG: AAA family ATPase [Bacteroidia bacterium]|nr:AAA family ATPase [Bacteroidia bacterium]
MQTSVLLPYGISDFTKIAERGYVFVDKTSYIELLEKNGESYVSFLRPRRFGKSLFISLLSCYYDIAYRERFEELFGKYYIGKNPTPFANSYRILTFDFSGISAENAKLTYQGFLNKVRRYVKHFLLSLSYFFFFSSAGYSFSKNTPEQIIEELFLCYPQDVPIYLLIDEYDHFTNDILLRSLGEFRSMVMRSGYVRKFYEVIKSATRIGVVDKIFITGVLPVTLDSLTSGFNILKHLTHHEEYQAMMGFTEEEVRKLLRLVVGQDSAKEEEVMQEMRYYYNGYKFIPDSAQNLYNSDMVLYFLEEYKRKHTYPRQMLDANIAPNYFRLKQVFRLAEEVGAREVIDEILEKGRVKGELVYQFNFEGPIGRKEFISLLYYLGSLTLEGETLGGLMIFRIPNKVIGQLYWTYYAYLLQEEAQMAGGSSILQGILDEMAETGEARPFFEYFEFFYKFFRTGIFGV